MRKKIYYLLILATSLAIASCSKNETGNTKPDKFPEIIELVTNVETKYKGNLTPYAIKITDDVASISFVESNINSTIHITDEKSKLCVELFREAIQRSSPLKIFTVGNSREIAQVNQSLKEDANYVEITSRYISEDYGAHLPNQDSIIEIDNLDFLQYLFDGTKGMANWDVTGEGCYARAHAVYLHILHTGATCYKFFLFGDGGSLYGYNPIWDCYAEWGWHVGALVFCEGNAYIIDPSCNDMVPVLAYDWANAIGGRFVITPGDFYLYNPYSREAIKDDDGSYTRCVLDYYKLEIGCHASSPHPCPPYNF